MISTDDKLISINITTIKVPVIPGTDCCARARIGGEKVINRTSARTPGRSVRRKYS